MKQLSTIKTLRLIILATFSVLIAACSSSPVIDNSRIVDNSDPFEPANRSVYGFNEGLDRNLMRPVASAYTSITPQVLRTGVTNFFNNVRYLNVILNSSMQGKLDQGMSDLMRFIFNSTLGVAGLFDVATPLGFEAHREDLGQTFAVWGTGQGPYLVVPALGPNTVRDAPDLVTSYFLNPLNYLASTVSLPATALYFINTRANLLEASDLRDSAAIDSYSFTREAYLQSRRNLIYDGKPPSDDLDDFFNAEFEAGFE